MTDPDHEVERFVLLSKSRMRVAEDGPWVRYSDYEKLEQRLVAQKLEIDAIEHQRIRDNEHLLAELAQAKAQALAEVREALKPTIERLERIRDIDEQTSDGALGSLARYALDDLSTLEDTQGEGL